MGASSEASAGDIGRWISLQDFAATGAGVNPAKCRTKLRPSLRESHFAARQGLKNRHIWDTVEAKRVVAACALAISLHKFAMTLDASTEMRRPQGGMR
jgi:hypothetical protein